MASVDHEHRLNIRVFKWAAKILIGKPDDEECTQTGRVYLIRVSSVAATAPEVIAVPYSMQDMQGKNILAIILEMMKHLSLLTSVKNLEWLAYDLLLLEMICKFGDSEKVWGEDPDHALVVFFDLEINHVARTEVRKVEEDRINEIYSKNMLHISTLKVNAGVSLEKVEEIEECLKMCPGMVVEGVGGMKEVKGFMEIGVLSGSKEDELICPICFERIRVGYRFSTTSCSHRFHKACIGKWLIENRKLRTMRRDLCHVLRKDSCPVCRSAFQVSNTWADMIIDKKE